MLVRAVAAGMFFQGPGPVGDVGMYRILTTLLVSALALGAVFATARATEDAAILSGCEPSATVELAARVVSIVDLGETARVIVEISLRSAVDLSSVRINRARLERSSRRGVLTLRDSRRTLRRGQAPTIRHTVELEQGKEHHLIFDASFEDAAGDLLETSAHVTVNLDPTRQPEMLDGLVQYRATMSR